MDLFESMGIIFNPKEILDAEQKADLYVAFMDAETNKEVSEIITQNLDFLNKNPRLYSFARNARRRINGLRKAKRQNTPVSELN
jgi:hypothetical protein